MNIKNWKAQSGKLLSSRNGELILGITTAIGSMIVVGYFAKGLWFTGDDWDFLATRRLDSLDALLRSHGGHWQTPLVILYRLLYGIFGLDFWPWYYLPRLMGYATMVFLVWRALRWRGADPVIAYLIFLILLFLGISDWHSIATVGVMIVYSCFMGAFWLILEKPTPTNRDRIVLFFLLLLALCSFSSSVALLIGTTVGLVVGRRFRAWWPSVVGAGAIYIAWYATYQFGSRASKPNLSLEALVALPEQVLELLSAMVAYVLPVPEPYTPVLVILLFVAILWLLHKGRLGLFEGFLFAAIGVFLLMVILVRVTSGAASVEATRYSHFVLFMLTLALVPHLQCSRKSGLYYVTLALLIGVGLYNVQQLQFGLNWTKNYYKNTPTILKTSARLLAAGEPSVPIATIDPPWTGQLSVSGLQRLLDDGWNPVGSSDPELVQTARGRLRMALWPGGRIQGEPPTIQRRLNEGCTTIQQGQPLTATVPAASTIELRAAPKTTVALHWEDRYGTGHRDVVFGEPRFQVQAFVTLAEPPGEGHLTFDVIAGESAEVCGLATDLTLYAP